MKILTMIFMGARQKSVTNMNSSEIDSMMNSINLVKDTRLVQKPEIIGFDESKKTVKFISSIETSDGTTFHLTEQIGKFRSLINIFKHFASIGDTKLLQSEDAFYK